MVFSRRARETALRALLDQPLTLRLFQDDREPSGDDEAGDFAECDFAGYAAVPLSPLEWRVRPHGPVEASGPAAVFTRRGDEGPPQRAAGWYLTDAGGELVCAGRFGEPAVLDGLGDRVRVAPSLGMGQQK